MLRWYENLYVSERASKKLKRTISRINRRKITPEIYVLTFPSNDKNIMDIVPTNVLLQRMVRKRCPEIIGIAKGKEDALKLMQTIVMETYENTGDFCVKEYLENRRKDATYSMGNLKNNINSGRNFGGTCGDIDFSGSVLSDTISTERNL